MEKRQFRLFQGILIGIAALYGIGQFLFGEVILLNDGCGWDGLWYCSWAQDFSHFAVDKQLTNYHIQRIVPSFIVHYSLRLFGLLSETHVLVDDYYQYSQSVITGFRVYHLVLYVGMAWLMSLIFRKLELSMKAMVIASLGFFFNFFLLKNYFYEPVMTDQSSIFLSTALLAAYLHKKPALVLILTVIGAFTHPLLIYFGFILLSFPYKGKVELSEKSSKPINLIFAGVFCLGILTLFIIGYHVIHLPDYYGILPVWSEVIYLSVALALVWFFFGIRNLISQKSTVNISKIWSQIHLPYLLVGFGVVISIKLIQMFLSSDEIFYYVPEEGIEGSLPWVLLYFVRHGTEKPLSFFIPHVIYLGPLILLLPMIWKKFSLEAQRLGPGILLVVGMCFCLSINSETRQLVLGFPFFVAIGAIVIDKMNWKRSQIIFWAAAGLFMSKVWFKINPEVWPGDHNSVAEQTKWPVQRLMMNYGAWILPEMYLLQGGIILIFGLILYFWIVRKKSGLEGKKDD